MLSPLYTADVIASRVKELAEALNKEYAGCDLVHAVVTLNGAFVFAADLIRQLNFPIVLHFAGATSYYGSEQKDLRINANALPSTFGSKPVLLIEDIIDSGNTIGALRQIIADRFPASIKVIALLRRQSVGGSSAEFHGFTIPQGLFVVGYGMDMDGRYRELPDLRSLGAATSSGVC